MGYARTTQVASARVAGGAEYRKSRMGDQAIVWFVGGLLGAMAGAYISYAIDGAGAAHLPTFARMVVVFVLLIVAVVAGFLAGAAIVRRATRNRLHIVPFSGLAAATAGGLIGLSQALALTIAYLANYASWPDDRLDQVLLVLSYPVFGALGLVIGALAGVIVGTVLGALLRVVSPAR